MVQIYCVSCPMFRMFVMESTLRCLKLFLMLLLQAIKYSRTLNAFSCSVARTMFVHIVSA